MRGLEKELIESIKNGNSKSFELVFKTWYKRLCTFTFGYTRQLETSEDIVKDFFVDFWNNREKLEIKTSLYGYLFRSVRNASINYLERDKIRNKTLSIEEIKHIDLKLKEPFSHDYPEEKLHGNYLNGRGSQAPITIWDQILNQTNIGSAATNWSTLYRAIDRANAVLDNVPNITDINPGVQTRILAEAHFLRALAYFELVRGWGPVPLKTAESID